MTLLVTGVLDVRASRLNPVTKIVALLVLALPVLITGNAVIGLVEIAGLVVALPVLGLGPRVLLRFAWPVVLALAGVALANFLASGSLATLVPITARLLALALPGLLLVLTTDPTELADALVQLWHVPARFAYGALAGLRLVPLLAADWTTMRRVRRARGLSAGANPLRALRIGLGLLFALLVDAIRRGVRLAAAMDARGFDSGAPRTFARRSALRLSDRVAMAAALVLMAVAVVVSVWWR